MVKYIPIIKQYIAREDVINTIAFYREDPDGVDHALQSIMNIPAADVQPVKHGRWIQDEHTYSGYWTYNYICSACGETGGSWLRNIRRDQMFPYCPFCGAKMDGEDNG